MSTTPRTDAQHGPIIENYGKMVPAYFARGLEEDLARVTAERDALEIHAASANTQIGTLRAHVAELTKQINDQETQLQNIAKLCKSLRDSPISFMSHMSNWAEKL